MKLKNTVRSFVLIAISLGSLSAFAEPQFPCASGSTDNENPNALVSMYEYVGRSGDFMFKDEYGREMGIRLVQGRVYGQRDYCEILKTSPERASYFVEYVPNPE